MTETEGYQFISGSSWDNLGELLQTDNPLFNQMLFLQGFDYCSNIYVIKGDYISIIDPGNDYTAYFELFELGVKPTDIKKICLTHGHPDNCMGALELFRGYPGYGKELDLEIILHGAGPKTFKDMFQAFGVRLTELNGGETINLSGFDFEVIHTPGHTLDGLCYYHAPTRTLFTGDTVLPHVMMETDKEAGGRMDHYLFSLRTLLKKEVDYIFPGRGGLVVREGRQCMEATYEGLIRKTIDEKTPWMEGAMLLAQKGMLEEALFCCNKVLADTPDELKAMEAKAFLLNDLGLNQEAVAAFDEVLSRNGQHHYAWMGKGAAFMALEQYPESLACFDHVLALQPNMPAAQVYKGMALYLSGQPEAAMEIEAFRREYSAKFAEALKQAKKEQGAGAPN